MSYSIYVKGDNVPEALGKLVEKFDEMVLGQQHHEKDRAGALSAAAAMASLLGAQPEGQIVYISLNGSLSWKGERDTDSMVITSASVGAKAYYGLP